MGALDDFIKKASDEVAKLDFTNPGAEYGQEIKLGIGAGLTALGYGPAGAAFVKAADGIAELNDATGNTFTINNIRDVANGSNDGTDHESKPTEEPLYENPEPDSEYEEEPLYENPEPDSGYITNCGFAPDC